MNGGRRIGLPVPDIERIKFNNQKLFRLIVDRFGKRDGLGIKSTVAGDTFGGSLRVPRQQVYQGTEVQLVDISEIPTLYVVFGTFGNSFPHVNVHE